MKIEQIEQVLGVFSHLIDTGKPERSANPGYNRLCEIGASELGSVDYNLSKAGIPKVNFKKRTVSKTDGSEMTIPEGSQVGLLYLFGVKVLAFNQECSLEAKPGCLPEKCREYISTQVQKANEKSKGK